MGKIEEIEYYVRNIYGKTEDLNNFTILDENSVLTKGVKISYKELQLLYILQEVDYLEDCP